MQRAPADIAYLTDLSLLNQSREKVKTISDILHEPQRKVSCKLRTYREHTLIWRWPSSGA
jgi:hypothetical protein